MAHFVSSLGGFLARIMLSAGDMIHFCSIVLVVVLILTGYPWPLFAAQKISVVVTPSSCGDGVSGDVASMLRAALRADGGFHVIEGSLADQVLDYYDVDSITKGEHFPAARDYLSRAQDHYFSMHYEEAAAEAERAVSLLNDNPASLHDKGQLLFDALMTQGMIGRAVKDEVLMREAFGRAAQLNPRHRLDQRAYPPSVIDMFDDERERLSRKGNGRISVTTDPPAAELFLNGILNGVTPLTMENLPSGTYALMIKTNKYEPVMKTIEVKSGRTTRVSSRLRWSNKRQPGSHDAANNARREIDECLRNADLLRADRGVLVADRAMADGSGFVRVRLVDRHYRAAYKPVVAPYEAKSRNEVIDGLAVEVSKILQRSIASDPASLADADGTADPILLGRNKRKIHRQPLFWGAIGTVVAGAVAGGVLAAMHGGGSDKGSVRIQFK